jgi:SAM-dependent methyltransferase
MTEGDLAFLRSARGAEALAAAAGLLAEEPLAAVTALRRRFTREESAAAWEQARLRARARAKFSRAREMFFEREALEQSTGERIARWRARRFAGREWVADLGCGLGGDALALAGVARVVAVDRDPLRLALLRENARACGLSGRIALVRGRVPEVAPCVAAAFADPSRRAETPGGAARRARSLAAMSPPFAALLGLAEQISDMGIKLSPALDEDELARALGGRPHELEFLSDGGECREAVLWLGGPVTAARRATVLPAGVTLARERLAEVDPVAPSARVGAYLYEPDAAIVRAHLIDRVAAELSAQTLDPRIAYLSSERLTRTPLAAAYAVREAMPFHLRRVGEALAARGYGDVVVKKRGFPAEPEAIRRQLLPRLRGGEAGAAILFLTRVGQKHLAIIAEKV